jgi:uncharacterized membrane protein
MPLTISKSRIEALSDGVFSIAMTLLVLKLDVPAVMHHHASDESMVDELFAMTPALVTYIVTFLIAGGFWFLHQFTFHFIRHVDAFLVWVNLMFLMLVSLLPFSAGLMDHLVVHPISQVFYFGNELAIACLLNVHWLYARHKGLTGSSEPKAMFYVNCRVVGTAAVFAACLVAGFFAPAYSWVPLPIFLFAAVITELFIGRT